VPAHRALRFIRYEPASEKSRRICFLKHPNSFPPEKDEQDHPGAKHRKQPKTPCHACPQACSPLRIHCWLPSDPGQREKQIYGLIKNPLLTNRPHPRTGYAIRVVSGITAVEWLLKT